MDTNEMTNKYFLPAAVVVAGLFIAGAVLWSGAHPVQAPTDGVGAAQKGQALAVDIKNIKTDGNPFIGKADAPVTIAFWSDFQCPYCKAFEVGGIPQIPIVPALPDVVKNYVDTGKVKIVFFDFTFLGNDSVTAALYNRSVWHLYPSQYFAWRTAMYTAQDEEGDKGFGNAATIDKLDATIAGLDAAKIAADVKANTAAYQALVDSDKAEAQKVGVNATPSFVIGTQMIPGAVSYDAIKSAIDAVLK
jgi:protein-disulfide isomerase